MFQPAPWSYSGSLTLRLLMSYIYIYMCEISSLRVNIIKWQVKFNPVA